MNNKDVVVANTKQIEELIDELKYLEAKLLPHLEGDSTLNQSLKGILQELRNANKNIRKQIEATFLSSDPYGVDFKNSILFVRYALLTDFESVKDVLHVARKLDDRDFISWVAKQVDLLNPEWTKDLNLKKVPFLKEVQDDQGKFDEICHQTIQEKKAQKQEQES